MTRAFADLCEAVLPPAKPIESGTLDAFTEVEARLGIAFPADYKHLVVGYGIGCWNGFLWVLNPFASNGHLNLFDQIQHLLDAERYIRAAWPNDVPFPLYPEPGGLLPWAITDNGDRLFWLTEGDADSWATVIYESRGPEHESHHMSCCEFLLRWLAGQLRVSVFPDDLDYGFVDVFEPLPAAE